VVVMVYSGLKLSGFVSCIESRHSTSSPPQICLLTKNQLAATSHQRPQKERPLRRWRTWHSSWCVPGDMKHKKIGNTQEIEWQMNF